MTKQIISTVCNQNSNCVDVGAYRGDILRFFLNYCPHGTIFAFEPVPDNFDFLRYRYPKAHVSNIALANKTGTSEYFVATGRPARSSLSKQIYPDPREKIESISVQTDSLDNLIEDNTIIDFIKIDVEGSELQVLIGAERLIRRHRPALLFEHGPINRQTSTNSSIELYELLCYEYGLYIWTLKQWLNGAPSLGQEQFLYEVSDKQEYYFFAKFPT